MFQLQRGMAFVGDEVDLDYVSALHLQAKVLKPTVQSDGAEGICDAHLPAPLVLPGNDQTIEAIEAEGEGARWLRAWGLRNCHLSVSGQPVDCEPGQGSALKVQMVLLDGHCLPFQLIGSCASGALGSTTLPFMSSRFPWGSLTWPCGPDRLSRGWLKILSC